jgi:hypothetical protein
MSAAFFFEALPPEHRRIPRVIRSEGVYPLGDVRYFRHPVPRAAAKDLGAQQHRVQVLLNRLKVRNVTVADDLMVDKRGKWRRHYAEVEIGSPENRQFWRIEPEPSRQKPKLIRLVFPVESWERKLFTPVVWDRMWRLTTAAYAASGRTCPLSVLFVPTASALAIAGLADARSAERARRRVQEVQSGARALFGEIQRILSRLTRAEGQSGGGPVRLAEHPRILDPTIGFVTDYAKHGAAWFPWAELDEVLRRGRNHWPAWLRLGNLPQSVLQQRARLYEMAQRSDTLLVGDASDSDVLGWDYSRGRASWGLPASPTLEPLPKVWFRRPPAWGLIHDPMEELVVVSSRDRGDARQVNLDAVFREAYAPRLNRS